MFERINYYHHFPLECLESNHGSFVLEKVKDFNFITFVNENFFGIIFLIWAFVAIIRIIHNCILMIKYRAGDNKYEIKRDKNEGEDIIKNFLQGHADFERDITFTTPFNDVELGTYLMPTDKGESGYFFSRLIRKK